METNRQKYEGMLYTWTWIPFGNLFLAVSCVFMTGVKISNCDYQRSLHVAISIPQRHQWFTTGAILTTWAYLIPTLIVIASINECGHWNGPRFSFYIFQFRSCSVLFRISLRRSPRWHHLDTAVPARKQGKSQGFDSCDRPNNLTQIGFKSSIFQPVWPWNLMDDLAKQ